MYENNIEVGILTFHESLNFGAILQAYGLQSAIKRLGYVVKIVDYHSEKKAYEYEWKFSKEKSWKQNILAFLSFAFYRKRRKLTDNFINVFLKISNMKYSENSINKIAQTDIKFVCGSDQVWNIYNTKTDWIYFLTFVDKKENRIAYGASTGVTEIEDKYRERFASEVKKFSYVSVRGKQEAAMLKKYCNINVDVVLDPTLLLDLTKWNSVESTWKWDKEYIFLYTLGWKQETLNKVREIARQENLPVVVPVFDLRSYFFSIKYGFGGVILGPQDYLSAIHHSKYIFTDAYHGIIFSIIYHKDFWVLSKNEKHNTESRIDDLLEMTGLEERKLKLDCRFDRQEEIDYQKVDSILDKEREYSLNYLRKCLYKNHRET